MKRSKSKITKDPIDFLLEKHGLIKTIFLIDVVKTAFNQMIIKNNDGAGK